MKKWFSLLLCLIMLAGLAACGETEAPGTDSVAAGSTGSSDATGSSDSEPEEWAPLEVMENKVIVSDYGKTRIVVYDLDLVGEDGNLERAEVWALENHYSPSIKYREDTVYGDVLLLTCDGCPMIFDFETKEMIWSTAGKASSNPHSIEILPSGNIITAASTDGLIRMYNAAACINDGADVKITTQALPGAHGVLWDPKYEVVWALGTDALVAYRVKEGENGEQTLAPVQGMGAPLPKSGGHDLSADLLDDDFLWCTSKEVYRFDKENNEWEERYENSAKLNKSGVKGFGNNLNKNYIFTQMKGEDQKWLATGKPDWSTDTIYYAYWKTENFLYVKECVSPDSAFYKARVFYGKYQ